MASSSSSSVILEPKYDVFLSFRGEDTRDNFTSHLYAALSKSKIQTFIDSDGLERGDEISPVLLKAIKESKISVIVFSKDYASSRWCLEELVTILECKKNGQMVIPVFYHVTPSDVRKQTGSFKDAFLKHEKDYKKTPEKVQRWRTALTKASDLSGCDSMVIKPESKLVTEIVREILKILNNVSTSNDYDGLVGINSRIDDIKSKLHIESSDFRILGIWGMGGIGKTTIARVIFRQILGQFEGSCYISNVRRKSKECAGLDHIRNKILYEILEAKVTDGDAPDIPPYMKKMLQRKKVLIVLDDVDDLEQLESLVGRCPQFGAGSRVIITSRDKQVLCSYGVHHIYEVEGLEHHEALQLFNNYAFKQNHPVGELNMLSWEIMKYAGGNPLALKVLGSSLYQKSEREWEDALQKLKEISNPKIHDLLIISYNALDDEEKSIFLDIACFFKDWGMDCVKKLLGSCYKSAEFGLSVLIDKSLITTSCNYIQMHDLLQEMGWEIVHKESPKEPGKRSRLWNHVDVSNVLKKNKGTDAVEGLFLDMSKIPDLDLSSRALENMTNLKFLQFYVPGHQLGDSVNMCKVHLREGLNYLSDELRYLYWYGYPLKTLPSNFSPKNLIILHLPCSKVDGKLWLETKDGSDFKTIGRSDSSAPKREHCQSLVDFPTSFQYLSNLCILNLQGCESITSFPSNIHFRCLIVLNLSKCINLTEFPQISGNIKELHLSETAIGEVPSSVACLTELHVLNLLGCTRLKIVSRSIYKLKSLGSLILTGCEVSINQLSSSITRWKDIRQLWLGYCNITEISEELCCLSSLIALDLSGNNFESLPANIKQLSKLRSLLIRDCIRLRSIPELPKALNILDAVNCWGLQSLPETPSNVEELSESELTEVFDSCRTSSILGKDLIFAECMNLGQDADNNITLADSQQRIQHMATVAMRLCFEKVFDEIPYYNLCLPGNKIPDWFSHKSSGSFITVELPHNWCNSMFKGFALSAVLEFENMEQKDGIKVACWYHYANVVFIIWMSIVSLKYEFFLSDQMVLGFSPCTDVRRLTKGENTTATFEFNPHNCKTNHRIKSGINVKSCGVHLLYAQPTSQHNQPSTSNEIFASTDDDLEETTLADSVNGENLTEVHDANASEIESGNGRSNEEEVEPNADTNPSLRGNCLSPFSCWAFLSCFFTRT